MGGWTIAAFAAAGSATMLSTPGYSATGSTADVQSTGEARQFQCTIDAVKSLAIDDLSVLSVSNGSTGTATATRFCEVQATLSAGPGSVIGVVYRLPENWNGRVLGLGGGGLAGNVRLPPALQGLDRGFATMQTDAGHPSTIVYDTRWAISNGQANVPAIEDFAYRAIHQMTVAGKALAGRYYGKTPTRAFFQGCSQGGRQGMEEAQRFPADYDGIITGAPAFDHIGSIASQSLSSRALGSPDARLTMDQIALVHTAVLKACDALDGAKDGIVADPGRCGYDPVELLCRSDQVKECLSPAQLAAVRSAYADRKAPDGSQFAYGLPRGSELTAFPMYQSMAPKDAQDVIGVGNLAPSLEFRPGTNYHSNDVVTDFWQARNSLFANLIQGDDPDMSQFVARGGKLLFWHGTYDQILSFRRFLAYYEKLQRVTSAELAARHSSHALPDSIRLFTLIGVGHCAGDVGPSQVDFLDALQHWVEDGLVPQSLVATKSTSVDGRADPVAAASPVQSRPVCAWPKLPHYKGNGDINTASSFNCAEPKPGNRPSI